MGFLHHLVKKSLLTITIVLMISSTSSSKEEKNDVSPPSNSKHCLWPTKKYYVFLRNKLPQNSNPLVVHCVSKDDDLGQHTLYLNQQIQWHFCDNIRNTRFRCYFWWNNQKAIIDVFSQSVELKKLCSNHQEGSDVCTWETREDGFYLSTLDGFKLYGKWG